MRYNPCPFCGSKDVYFENFDGEDCEGWPCRITCDTCGCKGPWEYCQKNGGEGNSFDDRAVIKAWNKRLAMEVEWCATDPN